MKLELKHIVGYLPYGLNAEYKEYFDDAKTDLGAFSTVEIIGVDFQNNKILIKNGYVTKRDSIKIILRPLSDLTKEIEVNGEKFVPIQKLNDCAEIKYYLSNWNEHDVLLGDFENGYNVLENESAIIKLYQ